MEENAISGSPELTGGILAGITRESMEVSKSVNS
jgi:hypothetical protein